MQNEINNTEKDNAENTDVVRPMYNSIEYSDNYSKTSGGLWQYYRDEPSLGDNVLIANFLCKIASFKFKQILTGKTGVDGTTDAEIMVPLKYLSNFWKTLKIALINFEINLILTCSANGVISSAAANRAITFAITDAKLYVSIVTLSTQDNAKLLQQM